MSVLAELGTPWFRLKTGLLNKKRHEHEHMNNAIESTTALDLLTHRHPQRCVAPPFETYRRVARLCGGPDPHWRWPAEEGR